MQLEFLSPEWIAAAKAIHAEYADRVPSPSFDIRVNVVVSGAPFGDGTVRGYVDAVAGQLEIEAGQLDGAELTIHLDYGTARAIFLDRDPQASMRAFLEGRIRPEGDVSKVLLLQPLLQGPDDPELAALASEMGERIREITA